mgnify:CR=1 FL=1
MYICPSLTDLGKFSEKILSYIIIFVYTKGGLEVGIEPKYVTIYNNLLSLFRQQCSAGSDLEVGDRAAGIGVIAFI